MDLPAEIREIIWHFAMLDDLHRPVMPSYASSRIFLYLRDEVAIRRYQRHKYTMYPLFCYRYV